MWDGAPDGLNLGAAEVHVWRVELDSFPAGWFVSELAPEEAGRRFHRPRDRDRFVVAHGALRRILSRYCGIAPEAIRLRRAARGKPHLEPESRVRFNLSHSDGLALVAVARDSEVGVDVERIRQISDAVQIARRVLPPEEAAALAALPPEARQEHFFRLWTRFEARLKAGGQGLGDQPAAGRAMDLEAGAGYVAAVAAAPAAERVLTWEYAER